VAANDRAVDLGVLRIYGASSSAAAKKGDRAMAKSRQCDVAGVVLSRSSRGRPARPPRRCLAGRGGLHLDAMSALSTRDGATPEPPHPATTGAAALVFFTVIACLRFSYRYLDDVARGEPGTAAMRVIEEATGAYAAALLFLGLVYFTWRFPIDRAGWRRHLPLHLAGVLAYSGVHTTLMWASRSLIVPLIGLGRYDYGRMPARYAMELGNDVISYGMLVALILGYRQYRALRGRELREARLERTLAQAELRNLRLQLQPHFLFNALNTISSTMYENPRAADRMIGQLAELLRLSLRTAHAHEVPVREELDVLDSYVGIMRARFGERLRVEVDVDDGALDALVPSLLLQPLVENAIRHGVGGRGSGGRVEVRIRLDGAAVAVEVADDGLGNRPEGRGFAVVIRIPHRPARPSAAAPTDAPGERSDDRERRLTTV
jgi:hypothetical protein